MNRVRVWETPLERGSHEVRKLHALLSAEERVRAGRFYREEDRRRFIVARGSLRILLADAADISPELIEIERTVGGKPGLATRHERSDICFNISHCNDTAVVAMGDRDIGIDLEAVIPSPDLIRMAANFFAKTESIDLENLTENEIAPRFFRTWVRKEAYLKATGKGFAIDPSRVIVPSSTEPRVRVINESGEEQVDERFVVHDLSGIDGHAVALAVSGEIAEPPSIELLT